MKTASSICSRNLPKKRTDACRVPAGPIRLILCDLGNVLINFDHRIAARKILPYTDKKFSEVVQLFFDSPATKAFEEGKISGRRFFEHVRRALALKDITYAQFVPIWNEIFSENKGILEVLKRLKRSYRLHLISNINELHYAYIAKNFPKSLAVFDRTYLSCSVGARKPDALIYRAAIREDGFRVEEALYTDDRRDLIIEAEKLGIRSVVFKNVADFRGRLRKMGIRL
jgi:FMN phosphatase YigB (HAD superfamily)